MENITTFLRLVNEMLRQVKGDPNYMWAPKCIMANENGANKNAIGNVFGEDLQKKTISCQWHYLRSTCIQSYRITDKAMRERFLQLTNSMVKDAVTKTLYIQYYKELYNICQKFKTTKWLDFWHERCAHYVPRFCRYGYPGLNLAEPRQSSIRTKRMTLVDAAFDDILKHMHQNEQYAVTLRNEVDGVRCQRKTVMQIMVECEAEQKKRSLLYIKTLQEFTQTGERLWQENPPTHDPEDPYFIPNESGSHRFIDPEEPKKKCKSQGKRKVNKDNAEIANKKKRTDATSATADTCSTPVQPATTDTCPTPVAPVTGDTCPTPVAPATPVTPPTPATQKGRGKGNGKSLTPKTPSVVTPNPSDYGPLVLDAIEKAPLETEASNICMYNNRIRGCFCNKCQHKWDSTRKADGVHIQEQCILLPGDHGMCTRSKQGGT